ncbi:hypothetical protein [Streptomyces sp. NRRL B-24484]|uniref:hypothetical protein n=1 Tax=Streptomyces sp. NRRL B-24484 TaxID=1463833 RepID=UPI0004BEB872|nr:hypothetical protein [Streptomyces sp. NRRL B-24484]
MNPRRKAVTALPAVTALLVFLAKHPDVAELPLSWDVRRDENGYDLWVEAEHYAPNGGELLHAVGKALRGAVTKNEFVSTDSGNPTIAYHLSGSTGGVSVIGDAFVRTADAEATR